MKVIKLKEAGYEEAVLGFSLSYNTTIERAKEILPKFAFGKPGENKFLESMIIWLDVTASRFVWAEMDTYRLSTKQSESTMHTLMKKELTHENFEDGLVFTGLLNLLNEKIRYYKIIQDAELKKKAFMEIKSNLPESFLQRRIWCMSYKTFRNIYEQRLDHKLPQWKYFCTEVLNSLAYPEFIIKDYNG